ncbi:MULTISPECIES: S8 family serine peptidase [Mycolicibacterium]|uniref:S8 family serine peptidase n=1 Tax=Mycolicibacterium TaxID=1866885 RepID=UPI00148F630D|nr:S8 family serine peptidase [Mycolicibacterium fortuitum]
MPTTLPGARTCDGTDGEGYDEPSRFILLPPEGLWPARRTHQDVVEVFHGLAEGLESGSPVHVNSKFKLFAELADESADGDALIRPLEHILPPPRRVEAGAVEGVGPTLVEMNDAALRLLRRVQWALRVVPDRSVEMASSLPARVPVRAPAGTVPWTVGVRDTRGNPVYGAEVTVYTDAQMILGDVGVTDQTGSVTLHVVAGPSSVIDRLYVRPHRSTYRGHYASGVTMDPRRWHTVELTNVEPSIQDCVRARYSPVPSDGKGVRIGIIDCGVDDTHPDLALAGGRNFVLGESLGAYGDNGTTGHGTHLAGIIAANPSDPSFPRGLAPSATVFSYRVFGQGATRIATTMTVLKSVIHAVYYDDCHLLNMSLGGLSPDSVWFDMDDEIWKNGALAFAAAGNTNRGAVSLPAALPHVAAVGAVGRKGTYPPGSLEVADEMGRFGNDPRDYTAAFSPHSRDVQLAAPGVGVMSTLPGGGYGPWSGTSQASAAALGRAASILTGNPVLELPPRAERSAALWTTLFSRLSPLGTGLELEGGGVLT